MSRYRWFRLHSEVRADPKLRVLPHDERWTFICLLCLASEQTERGTIPPMSPFRLAAEVADGDPDLLRRTLDHLVELDIVRVADDGSIQFVNWRARQYDYPSDEPDATAERQRRHRARLRTNDDISDDVTSESRVCHEPSRAGHEQATSGSRVDHHHVTSDLQLDHDHVTSESRASHEASRDQNTEYRIQTTERKITTTPTTETTGDRSDSRANDLVATATDVEREVVSYILAVPGMQTVSPAEVLEHYRAIVAIRGPCSAATERLEAMRFRDYWTERRKGRSDRWRAWRTAMTNWFGRTKETQNGLDGRGAGSYRETDRAGSRAISARPAVDYDRYARYVEST